MADTSFGGLMQLKVESIPRLTRVPAAWYELQLILSSGWLKLFPLVYQVNLRTHSAKCIIFMVCLDWFQLSLIQALAATSRTLKNLEEAWGSLRKLEEAWRNFNTLAATDSSCGGWFELRRLIRDLRSFDYLQNFDPDTPWSFSMALLQLKLKLDTAF